MHLHLGGWVFQSSSVNSYLQGLTQPIILLVEAFTGVLRGGGWKITQGSGTRVHWLSQTHMSKPELPEGGLELTALFLLFYFVFIIA